MYTTTLADPSRVNLSEHNDCAVIALSILLEKPYEAVHKAFKKVGRPDRKGVSTNQIEAVIKMFKGDIPTRQYCRNRFGKRITTSKIGQYLPKGKYLLLTTNHAVALVNSSVEDWTATRRNQVIMFMRIDD